MRLVEFLILLLDAQAQTLQRLAALFGEEGLILLLEAAGELAEETPPLQYERNWFEDLPVDAESSSAYAELEGAVREFQLTGPLQFHLWAYPHYRSFIESELDLNLKIAGPGQEAGSLLVEQALKDAENWLNSLSIPAELKSQAERAVHVPWLRFRTAALKRIGRRPLGPVY